MNEIDFRLILTNKTYKENIDQFDDKSSFY